VRVLAFRYSGKSYHEIHEKHEKHERGRLALVAWHERRVLLSAAIQIRSFEGSIKWTDEIS